MKNLHAVSGILFFLIGFAYFFIALLVYNQSTFPNIQIIFNILDMPFAFIAVLYAVTGVILHLQERNIQSRMVFGTIIFLGITVFSAIAFVNFMYIDVL